MPAAVFNTPVIYIFFNRPDVTRRTFAVLRALRPRRLYLIADGPRSGHPTDAARCNATREVVEQMLTWPCEVHHDYSTVNLGAGRRIATGLTSAFALLGEAIVLEDDIMPHPDFFPFCAGMLARYRDDADVHGISGFNPIGRFLPHESCEVNTLTHITWGWASWQRAWKDYRATVTEWDDGATRTRIRAYLNNDLYFNALALGLKAVADRTVDAWDYQWVFTMLAHRRRAIVSSTNLITNLGFSPDSTHTHTAPTFIAGLAAHPLVSSSSVTRSPEVDRLFDRVAWQVMLDGSPLKIAVLRLLSHHSRWLTSRALPLPANVG